MGTLCLRICMLIFLMQYFTTGFSLLNKNTSVSHVCSEDESQLLLQFKQQLSPLHPDRYYKTKYWKGSRDCCTWDGVTCDYFTGHVIALDLNCDDLVFTGSCLGGKLKSNSSLFRLTHIRRLYLGQNDFGGSTLPPEFGRLNALTHLYLSFAEFEGEIPMEFYHLSKLVYLDLITMSNNTISCDVKMLFGNMTSLRSLRLSGQKLVSEIPTSVSSSLTRLDLSYAGLYGKLPASIFEIPTLKILNLEYNEALEGSLPKSLNSSNLRSIQSLDLSGMSISGKLPDSIDVMRNLEHLGLSDCGLSGPIPDSTGNITAIRYIYLSMNEFSGRVPSTISNLAHLTGLELNRNHLEGQLPDVVWGLEFLDVSNNSFVGQIPSSSLTNNSQLFSLDISSNAFTGTIPPWLFSLPSLTYLTLSSNKLTGSIGELYSKTLSDLDLSSNKLNINLRSFYNLSSIERLRISHNTLTEHHGDSVVNVTFPNLNLLLMSSCEIKEFPNFNMPKLHYLDLSNNNIQGPIPNFLSSNLAYLYFHSNLLQGTFPSSICNITHLSILDFSYNKLTGNIPKCLANSSTLLEVLDLRRNEFHGRIPITIGAMYAYLAYLGLNGNHFQGPLPPSLANCTQLETIDLGNNMIQDTFPWWLHSLPKLKILILKSNNFHGSITSPVTNNSFTNLHILDLSYNNFTGLLPKKLFATLQAIKSQSLVSSADGLYMERNVRYEGTYEYSVTLSMKGGVVEFTKVLRIFTTIDLSNNNFFGSIPDSLSNLTSLRLLNLSHNNINGSIPPTLGRMTNLEQLDLSSNQLMGGIPQTLTNLTFLGDLDLSHNHLSGPIPQANQFLTFSNESYAGNLGLCGYPLTRSCGNEREPPSAEEDEDDGYLMGFTWKAVVIGYGCGTLLGFILGNVLISIERPAWLARFVYVEATIILSKRKKRRRLVQGRK